MRFAIVLLACSAFGQNTLTTTRLNVRPYTSVGSGASVGDIRFYDVIAGGGSYISLFGQSNLAASKGLTLPAENALLIATENHQYHDSQAFTWSAWRARGTETSPANAQTGDDIFSVTSLARIAGSFTALTNITTGVYTDSPATGTIYFYTRNASGYDFRVQILPDGHIVPNGGDGTSQTLGFSTIPWQSAYLNGSVPVNFDRSAITTAQRMVWNVAGSSGVNGSWLMGLGPNASQSQFELTHNASLRLRVTQGSGIFWLDNLFPETTNTYALGSPTFRWNNLYVNSIDVTSGIFPTTNNTAPLGSTSLRFSKLWVTDIDCSGTCGTSIAPPVVWDLDTTGTVLTLGTHGASGAFQLTQRHSRGTLASPTTTADNDRIGQVAFQLYAGGSYLDAAAIRVEADGTPTGTSSPARIGFFTTPAGTTTPVERLFLQQDGEFWIRSAMTGDRPLYLQNDSSSGYSVVAYLDNAGVVKGYTGWNNSASATNPSVFVLGTRTNDLVGFLQNDIVRWTLSSTGLVPNSDGAQVIGNSSLKPASITSRSYFSETNAAYGTQQNTLAADANLNLYLIAASSSSATDRASLQFYRSRNTVAFPTSVASGDRLGNIAWVGYASGVNAVGGVIEAYVNGTVSGGIVPTELRFRTMNPAGTLADRAVLDANGFVVTGGVQPNTSGAWSLGGSGKEWANAFMLNLTLSSGAGQGVQGNFVPNTNNANNLGSSSYYWNTIHANHFDAYGDIVIIASSITRVLLQSSSVATFDSSGNTTFAVNTSDGAFQTRNHTPQANNTYDSGSTSLRWRDVFIANDINFGAGGGILAPNGNFGMTLVITVRDSTGTGNCTITFSAGIATASTC